MSGRVAGRVAIVTGGARGIGEAVTRRLVAEGAQVVIADVRADLGEVLVAELGPGAVFVEADVTRQDAWTRVIATADTLGGVDILVNNAGGALGPRLFMDADAEHHQAVMDLNLNSVWLGMHAAIPVMRRKGGGAIVNISSIDGLYGMKTLSSYSAAKFAVTGLTRTVSLEVGRDNIRVNAVHPGFIATPLLLSASPERMAEHERTVAPQPIARFGTPAEIAGAVLFFACDDSSFCTGASLLVDGGRLAGSA